MAAARTVLVTGATGRVGGQVVAQLAGTGGVRVRALSRGRATAPVRHGVEVVPGDLSVPDSLDAALAGVDAVFLVFPSVAADSAARELVVTLAKRVRRIVYLSAYGVPDRPDPDAEPDGSILGSHAHLEGRIAAAAAEHTFLRASGFAANTLAWAPQIRRSDVVRWFFPDARRGPVHEADVAAVGVRALTADAPERRAYHVTGPEQLTQAEQLAAIGEALGRSLRFEEIDATAAAAELFPGLPAAAAAAIVAGHARMVAHPEPVTDTVARLTDRPALPFAQWARDHVEDFTAPATAPGSS